MTAVAASTLVIACGAIAREVIAITQANRWSHVDVTCLPAELHNRPEKIPGAVQAKIRGLRARYDNIFVAYADCGTGGLLDKVLEEEGVERIAGAHCYEFYAGSAAFAEMAEQELGTFYLTDFLLRHFDRLVIRGLGIDRHPQLLQEYFGNYRKLVYLAQAPKPEAYAQAEAAADRLGLVCEIKLTGYGELASSLSQAQTTFSRPPAAGHTQVIQWQN
jgi:hypothetical protein